MTILAAEIARIDRTGTTPNEPPISWVTSPGASILAAHWDHYFVECTQAREHLASTVEGLVQAGIRLGIVTNGRSAQQRRKVELLGLRDRLGALVIS